MRPRGLKRLHAEDGNSTVEFGLIAVMFIIVLLGVVDMGRMVLVYTTLAESARAGTRYAIVHGGDRSGAQGSGPNGQSGTTDNSYVQAVVKDFASGGLLNLNNLNTTVTYFPSSSNAVGSTRDRDGGVYLRSIGQLLQQTLECNYEEFQPRGNRVLRRLVMRVKHEEGQAIVLVALAMSIFLLGAVGLAVDGSHLYSQRQMAQTAADAAAISGMMSVFDGTNGAGTAGFTATEGTSFTCTSQPNSTPCQYASKDGFALSSDTVTVSFPADSAAPGVSFSSDATHLIQVTVQRSVKTTLLRFLGPTATTVQANAMAAIVSVVAPVPILITDPTNPNSLSSNGGVDDHNLRRTKPQHSSELQRPERGLYGRSGTIDLSHAGPADPGDCSSASAGADFGVFGGDATNPGVNLGTAGTGHYVSPASPVLDPLAGVSPPLILASTAHRQAVLRAEQMDARRVKPARYIHQATIRMESTARSSNTYLIFKPGIYYVQNGFTCSANCNLYSAMCVGFTADTGAGTC